MKLTVSLEQASDPDPWSPPPSFAETLPLQWMVLNASDGTVEPLWEACSELDWLVRFGAHFVDRECVVRVACECARATLPLIPAGVSAAENAIAAAEADPCGAGDPRLFKELLLEVDRAMMQFERFGRTYRALDCARGALLSATDMELRVLAFGVGSTADGALEALAPEEPFPISEARARAEDLCFGIVRGRMPCPTLTEVIDVARRYTARSS